MTKQHLAGRVPKKTSKGDLVDLVRDIIYVQWDPVPIVAPSHVIAIWSRVGKFQVQVLLLRAADVDACPSYVADPDHRYPCLAFGQLGRLDRRRKRARSPAYYDDVVLSIH